MKFSLKAVALGALLASAAVAAPVDVEKRDAVSDRIAACFVGLIFTGAWPSSCKAAVAVPLGLIKTITINQMSMDFTPADPWKPVTSSNNIVSTMLSIPGITLPINSIRQHIILTDNGVQLGSIETPWAAASVKGGTLTTSFPSSVLNVFPTSKAAFAQFVGTLSAATTKTVTLQGAVDAKLSLGIFGHLTIPGIGFKVNTEMKGLQGLAVIDFKFMVDQAFDFANNIINLSTIVNIKNPSNLSLKLGDVSFVTTADTGFVGYSTIKSLNLVPGDNFVISNTALNNTLDATKAYLEAINHRDGPLTMTGYSGTSSNVALNPGLAHMKSLLVVPKGFQGALPSQAPYKDWAIKILPTTKTDGFVDVTATFQSPYFGYPFEMTNDNADGGSFGFVKGVSPDAENVRIIQFVNNLTFKVPGTGSVTKTFKASIGHFVAGERGRVESVIAYAKANGGLNIDLNWFIEGKLNDDPTVRFIDWGSSGSSLYSIKLKTGADFDSLIDSVPSA